MQFHTPSHSIPPLDSLLQNMQEFWRPKCLLAISDRISGALGLTGALNIGNFRGQSGEIREEAVRSGISGRHSVVLGVPHLTFALKYLRKWAVSESTVAKPELSEFFCPH